MINLDTTTKSLEIVLGGTVTTTALTWTASYVDLKDATQGVYDVAELDGTTNNTTAVTMVGAPGAGHTRQIKFISVVNVDTLAAVVTLRINNNSTLRQIVKVTLDPGDNLLYVA
jgi:hypothetical protein